MWEWLKKHFKKIETTHEEDVTISFVCRWILVSFVSLFLLSRLFAFLIIKKWVPWGWLIVDGKHIHHFVFGILLLSIIGFYTLWKNPTKKVRAICAFIYGSAIALIYDEFAMWLTLDGGYYSSLSTRAITFILCVVSLVMFFPQMRKIGIDSAWERLITIIVVLLISLGVSFSVADLLKMSPL